MKLHFGQNVFRANLQPAKVDKILSITLSILSILSITYTLQKWIKYYPSYSSRNRIPILWLRWEKIFGFTSTKKV
jgi:hypothetical protein